MGSADGDGGFILAHHLPEELCPCEGGDPLFLHGKEFRVIGMDGAGVDLGGRRIIKKKPCVALRKNFLGIGRI